MKLQGIGALTIAATAAVLLTSCASGGGGEEESDTENATLTFQAFANTPEGQTANEAIVEAWNADHPETQIELIMTPIDSVYDKISTQMAGGTAPDILMDDAQDIRQYVNEGYIADLSDYLASSVIDSIDSGVLDTVTIDDKLAGIATEMQTYVVFANTDLLAAAGIEVPSGDSMTWDELENLARKATTDDTYGITWGLKSPTAAFISLGLGFDAQYFTGEDEDAEVALGDAEMEVPERVKAMIDDGSIDPVGVTQPSSDVLPTFYGGKAAMIVQQSYHIANVANDAPAGLNWAVLPPLEGSAGTQQAAIPTTISVSAQSDHPQKAADFLAYYMEAKNLASINRAEGLIPTTADARAELADQTADLNGWAEVLKSGETLVAAPASSATNYPSWKTTVATPAYQQYLSGAINAEQLAMQLEDGWDQVNR